MKDMFDKVSEKTICKCMLICAGLCGISFIYYAYICDTSMKTYVCGILSAIIGIVMLYLVSNRVDGWKKEDQESIKGLGILVSGFLFLALLPFMIVLLILGLIFGGFGSSWIPFFFFLFL